MSVIETDKIDAIGIVKKEFRVYLSIIDPLVWDDENVHLFTLQEKINSYLYFFESGELLKTLPEAEGFDVVIELILKYSPPSDAITFFDKTIQILLNKGVVFVFGPHPGMEYC